MNSIQAKSYLDILKKGLINIVAAGQKRDWQQQRFCIFSETRKALDSIPQFSCRLIEEVGGLFIDNRNIESEMPESDAKEFRSLIRAYSIIVSTTRNPDEFQFMTKRTKVLQMINNPQVPIITSNNAMAKNVREETIYRLSQISKNIYIEFIKDFSKFKIHNSTRVCAVKRDRGRKADYIHMPDYEVSQVNILVQSWKANEKWFDSIYLNWVMYEVENDINKLPVFFSFLFDLFEDRSFLVVLCETDFECYGCCMSLYTIIDKIFLLHGSPFYKNNRETIIKLLKLTLLSSLVYLNYHKGKDSVRDAEIYSSYARIFYRFEDDVKVILPDAGDFSVCYWYYYCWGMENAMTSIPIEYLAKNDYHKSALMMKQNGTVLAVTKVPLNASLSEAVKLGGIYSVQLYKYLIGLVLGNKIVISINDRRMINTLEDVFLRYNMYSKTQNNIRCIARYYQLEPYSAFGKIEQPYLAPRIPYTKLLDNFGNGIDSSIVKNEDVKMGGYLVTVEHLHLWPHLHGYFKKIEYCIIFGCWIITDNSYNIRTIKLFGMNLYPVKLDVTRTGLFYDIPCMVKAYYGRLPYQQTILLQIGTDNDLKHGLKDSI